MASSADTILELRANGKHKTADILIGETQKDSPQDIVKDVSLLPAAARIQILVDDDGTLQRAFVVEERELDATVVAAAVHLDFVRGKRLEIQTTADGLLDRHEVVTKKKGKADVKRILPFVVVHRQRRAADEDESE